MAEVVLKKIKKIYPYSDKKANKSEINEGVVAVQEFDLDIADKEFVVLVGPSGCGKSTTLRMVAGLEEITDGELYIDGKLMNDIAPSERDIAMVFQNYALYPHMTVYENMAFSLKLKKMDKKEIDKRVRETAQILDITNLLDRKPKALSGGQRQRVAIGRAFVRNPKVFLMDEPLSNLDAKLRNQMRTEIIKLRSKIDTTFIYVTHDQVEAMTLGDRIVVMKDGYVQQIGTPQDVFNNPINRFVAGFIGMPQMNFFPGCRLLKSESDEGFAIDILGRKFQLTEMQNNILCNKELPTKDIVVGVRPENVNVFEGENVDTGFPTIEAKVELAEMMGSEMHLHVRAGNSDIVAVLPTIEVENMDINIGSRVRISFKPKKMHLFNSDTEENILI